VQEGTVFRIANDTIAERARQLGISGAVPFICECSNDRCFRLVHITVEEYERRARSGPLTSRTHRESLVGVA
jgi:hypothetical protein